MFFRSKEAGSNAVITASKTEQRR